MNSAKRPPKCGYRTPNTFRRNTKHKIAKIKIHGKISHDDKSKKTK